MIVVIGAVRAEQRDGAVVPGGVAAHVALAAAAGGRRVEIVTRMGDDPMGDAVLLALTRAGVGHVATLRDAAEGTPVVALDPEDRPDAEEEDAGPAHGTSPRGAPSLDANDVGLALRYLPEITVIVLVHPGEPGVIAEASSGAGYASAALVVLLEPGAGEIGPADGAVVLEVPRDAEAVGETVGRFAAALDAGEDPKTAFAATVGRAGEPPRDRA